MGKRHVVVGGLTLFEADALVDAPGWADASGTTDRTSPIKWSFSKRGLLMQCPRKYYYQYFGGHAYRAKDDPDKATLRQLKTMTNREERTGEILHFTIANYFRLAQQNQPMPPAGLITWARKVFRKDIEFSRGAMARAEGSNGARSPRFLLEFLHEDDPAGLCAEAESEMVTDLKAFLGDPTFEPARRLGMTNGTLIEKHFSSLHTVPFGVEGQVDLAYVTSDRIVTIVDWKSGAFNSDGDDSLQLVVYAQWAIEEFGCSAEQIILEKAFLASGDLVGFVVNASKLDSARLAILQDGERFARLVEYGNLGVVEAFTPCVQEQVCRRCPFVTVCPEGMETLR